MPPFPPISEGTCHAHSNPHICKSRWLRFAKRSRALPAVHGADGSVVHVNRQRAGCHHDDALAVADHASDSARCECDFRAPADCNVKRNAAGPSAHLCSDRPGAGRTCANRSNNLGRRQRRAGSLTLLRHTGNGRGDRHRARLGQMARGAGSRSRQTTSRKIKPPLPSADRPDRSVPTGTHRRPLGDQNGHRRRSGDRLAC